MPAALSHVLASHTYNWYYASEPEPHLNERRLFCPRGKTLGGSSAINGMIFVRGHPMDFDRWAAQTGYEDWRYEACLPWFRKSERVSWGEPEYRGRQGPMRLSRGSLANPLFRAFLDAAQQAGWAVREDLNGRDQEGVGPFDRTIYRGRRWSAARAYLDPMRDNDNLTLMTRCRVERVVLDGTRAVAVDIVRRGTRRRIEAGEVILCAGAIDSPKILMLSGIGDPDELARHDIRVRSELPGVGKNLMDHLEVYVQYACRRSVSLYPALKWYNQAWIGPLWYLMHAGPAASNHFEAGGFIKSVETMPYPDLQLHFLPVAMNYDGTAREDRHGFQVHVGPMKPTSRGDVSLRDDRPTSSPMIRFNYAATPDDRAVMRAGIRKVREIVMQRAFDDLRGDELMPGDAASDEELDAFVREHGESAYHPCGTCRMGQDALAVVDNRGRLHGLENLRVVDASIMPEITNGNLNAPVLMLAEKIAASMV